MVVRKHDRRLQPKSVVSRRRCGTDIKPVRRVSTSKITPDTVKGKRKTSYMTTRSQTKTRRSTHHLSKLTKQITHRPIRKPVYVNLADKNGPEKANKYLTSKVIGKEPSTTSKAETKLEAANEGNVMSNDITDLPKTPRTARTTKPDYVQLAGIKRRSMPPFPELPRFARKARRRGNTTRKRTGQDTGSGRPVDFCQQSAHLTGNHDNTENLPSPKPAQVPSEPVATRNDTIPMDTEKVSTQLRRKIARDPFLERDSQQKIRKRLVKNESSQKSDKANRTIIAESLKVGEVVIDVSPTRNMAEAPNVTGMAESPEAGESSDTEDESSCALDYFVDEAQTSPEFVEYFHESRRRPKPDPDVYNWPREWLPKPHTPLVPANTSALEIDPPITKTPYHVFENIFYLQSPPKMRSEMERWKFNFDYNPQVEQARSKKIKETERQLLAQNPSGRHRTKTEKAAIKKQAKKMVETETYLEQLARYNERKTRDMEIMRQVYRERNLGEPLDTDDIAEMAMDIKHKVYLKSMKIAHPEHVLVQDDETDSRNDDQNFPVPSTDTITDETRRVSNQILQESECAFERDLGVVINEAEIRPAPGVNYVYESYMRERSRALDHTYSDNQTQDISEDEPRDPTNNPPQRMTLWYGHEKHRKMEQHKKQRYAELMPSGNSMYGSSYDVENTYHQLDNSENESVFTISDYNEWEHHDEEAEDEVETSSQHRMTLWYGHSQNSGDDEDEVVRTMCGGSQRKEFSDNFDDKEEMNEDFYSVNGYSTLWDGQEDLIYRGTDESTERGTKRTYDDIETEEGDKMLFEDENDEEFTFTRTVPFLYLTTEDLPLRVRTQSYKFQRTSPDNHTHKSSIDR